MDVRTTPRGETHQKELRKLRNLKSGDKVSNSLFYPGGRGGYKTGGME